MSVGSGMVIAKPDDFHVHLREGETLKRVLPDTCETFGRALIMPNLSEPVWDAERVIEYRDEILASARAGFEPLMTIYLTEHTTPDIILEAAKAGAVAAKFYPKHGTTQAQFGLTFEELLRHDEWFEALGLANMVLCLHGEDPARTMTRREHDFLIRFENSMLATRFPRLRFVIEHASTAFALDVASRHPNVAVTITAHHLVLTTDDVIGDHDCLCMPVAKSWRDRNALIEAVLSGRSDVFFGSDSAPHPRFAKDLARGAFGLYTAPVAIPIIANIFAINGRFQGLQDFTSKFGAEWYQLPASTSVIEIVRENWTVPDSVGADVHDTTRVIRPFMAGRELHWRVRSCR